MKTLSIIVCGWHFKYPQLYETLKVESHNIMSRGIISSLFIASHKNKEDLEDGIIERLVERSWTPLFFENEGWDWGCFQQFLQWQKEKDNISDYYLFLQDDVKIIAHGFVDACLAKISRGVKVVGNGIPVQKAHRVRNDYPEDILWAETKGFSITSEEWEVVRGSFVFTTREVAEEVLLVMPIKKGQDIALANSSLRVFGGLVRDKFGKGSVAYLGSTLRKSTFIEEEYRGNVQSHRINLVGDLRRKAGDTVAGKVFKRIVKGKDVRVLGPGEGLKIRVSFGRDPSVGYFNVDSQNCVADASLMPNKEQLAGYRIVEVYLDGHHGQLSLYELFNEYKKYYEMLCDDGRLIIACEIGDKYCPLASEIKRVLVHVGFKDVYCTKTGFFSGTTHIVADKIYKIEG